MAHISDEDRKDIAKRTGIHTNRIWSDTPPRFLPDVYMGNCRYSEAIFVPTPAPESQIYHSNIKLSRAGKNKVKPVIIIRNPDEVAAEEKARHEFLLANDSNGTYRHLCSDDCTDQYRRPSPLRRS